MSSVLNVFGAFMTEIEKPGPGRLGVKVILGYPDVGRTSPVFPLGAMTFQNDDYARNAGGQGDVRPRMGQVQPAGMQFAGLLHLFAVNERDLLGLVDQMRGVKAELSNLLVDGHTWVVRFGATERNPFSPEEDSIFNYSVVTPVRFIRND